MSTNSIMEEEVIPVSRECGKSNLLLSEALAIRADGSYMPNFEKRTVIPVPTDILLIESPTGNLEDNENFVNFLKKNLELYSILIEYVQLPQFSPHGVYCIPSWENIQQWEGVIFVRRGLYAGGVFKFTILMDGEYPTTAPVLQFITKVYHPLVDPKTGTLDIEPQFPKWDAGRDYIPMLLVYMKEIFYKVDLFTAKEHPYNAEAYNLFMTDKSQLILKIQDCTKESQEKVYQAPPNFAIQCSEFDPNLENAITALESIANNPLCPDPKETFVNWFLDEWIPSEIERMADLEDTAGERRDSRGK